MFGSHDRSSHLRLSGSQYVLAIVAALCGFGVTLFFKRVLPTSDFLFFLPAVAFAAWYGGRGTSFVATMFCTVLLTYVVKTPGDGSLAVSGFPGLLLVGAFLIKALIITELVAELHRARDLADSRTAELAHANEELRHALVSRRLLAEQETERGRISRVLHDDIGQLLTVLRLNLQRLTAPVKDDEAVIRDSIGLVDETLNHVRAMSMELRPTVLDDLGLGEAVAWYANRQAERAGYTVVVDQALGEDRLPEAIETAGFRIAQQALTNVARHARANTVHIGLRRNSHSVELSVADDGIGFDVAEARKRSQAGESVGLVDMTELAYMAGGILTITSTTGKGSTVRVQFPVSAGV